MQYQAAVVVYILDAHVLCTCHMTATHVLVCGCGLCHISVDLHDLAVVGGMY